MTDLTSAAKKIMEVFRYFRIKQDEFLSMKLLLSKRELWQNVEEEQFQGSLEELIEKGFIGKKQDPHGWRLLEKGDEYIKQLQRY